MAQTFNCPSCGAPLEPDGDTPTIHCKYCNESVIVPADLRSQLAAAQFRGQDFQAQRPAVIDLAAADQRLKNTSARLNARQAEREAARKQRRRSFGLVIVMVFIGLAIFVATGGGAALLYGLYSAVSSASGGKADISQVINTISQPNARVMDSVVVVPMPDTKTPNLLLPIDNSDTDVYQYAMLDGVKKTILWRSEPVGNSWSDVKAFAFEKRVYIFSQTTLTALDPVTGKQAWKASLDNGLGYCKTCLLETGNAVVVILKDGTVQAVDAASGKLTWHKTLNDTNSDLFLADGKAAAVDRENDKDVFYVFDPPTGQIFQKIQPGCPAAKPSGSLVESIPAEDGKSIVLLFNDCVQRVTLRDGKVLSEVVTPESSHGDSAWPIAWFATKHLVTQTAIYYTGNGSSDPLNTVDIAGGNARQLIVDKKFSIVPKFVSGDVLVAEAVPGYDSNQHEYWGINTQSGQRMWQYALKGQGRLTYYDMRQSSRGLFVVQCREEPDGCTWATVDSKTGVGSNTGTGPGGPFIDPAWGRDTLYLAADGPLLVIDTTTAKQLYQWP